MGSSGRRTGTREVTLGVGMRARGTATHSAAGCGCRVDYAGHGRYFTVHGHSPVACVAMVIVYKSLPSSETHHLANARHRVCFNRRTSLQGWGLHRKRNTMNLRAFDLGLKTPAP